VFENISTQKDEVSNTGYNITTNLVICADNEIQKAYDVLGMGCDAGDKECIQSFVGKHPLGTSRRRWEDTVMMDLTERGCEGGKWMELAEDRVQRQCLVSVVFNIWFQILGGK